MALDILAEDQPGPCLLDDPADLRPEMTRVVGPLPFARERERLTGIAGRDNIHAAAPRTSFKGGKVRPERCAIQGLVRHPRHESGRRECVPLDITNSVVASRGDVKTELKSACA